MNKFFRCNGLTKEQAIQAARDVAEREGLGLPQWMVDSLEMYYCESDIVIFNNKEMNHADGCAADDTMQEVPALKPLTIDEADRLLYNVNENFEIDVDGDLCINDVTYPTTEQLEQILQIMKRIEK
jgi:hypothetical protein